jgi:ubiquinone/menaquinone biosynthesis C-methylase UbiE
MAATDKIFAGSIPETYDRYLVPLIFEPYARDLAARASATHPHDVLETAAGTGVLTRALMARLPAQTRIVATDLNQPMLDYAAAHTRAPNVSWRQCDAQELPFSDGEFDVVVCQFGAMFFPDKRRAYAEARRVLRDGGRFVFSVWDRIEENQTSQLVTEALAARFPDDPPRFLPRVPYAYFDEALIRRTLGEAGFADVDAETVPVQTRTTASDVAIGFCQGCPLSSEIEARAPGTLAATTAAVTAALAARLGEAAFDTKVQAIVFTARR